MWNKNEAAGRPATRTPSSPDPSAAPWNAPTGQMGARTPSCLGPGLSFKGEISGGEDLKIDGKVEGAISLPGHRLTVGTTAQITSEVGAREVVVYGKVSGNLRALDRVEIKKDGSVAGDITTARISIEDGAYFKGRIEIDRTSQPAKQAAKETAKPQAEKAGAPMAAMAN